MENFIFLCSVTAGFRKSQIRAAMESSLSWSRFTKKFGVFNLGAITKPIFVTAGQTILRNFYKNRGMVPESSNMINDLIHECILTEVNILELQSLSLFLVN